MLPVPHDGVIFQRINDGAVVLDVQDEVYYGLNRLGARIWELLPGCGTADELVARLGAEYPEVEEPRIRTEALALVHALAGHGLLRPALGVA